MATILSIGLSPASIDYERYPQLDEASFTARIAKGEEELRASGLDFDPCYVSADPDEAEAQLRTHAGGGYKLAMIGAGLRMAPEQTLLFERLVNTLIELFPGIRMCFNTSPESTGEAMRRGLGR